MKKKIFFGIIFVFAAGFLIQIPGTHAAECTAPASGDTIFSSVQTEYVNGLLWIRLQVASEAQANGGGNLSFYPHVVTGSDCEVARTFDRQNVFPTNTSTAYSIRFISHSKYEIWDDVANVRIQEFCPNCSYTLGNMPDYYQMIFEFRQAIPFTSIARTQKLAPFYITPTHGAEPVLTDTLPTPAGCTPYSVTRSSDTTVRHAFEEYERAEYVDGLLRYHFKFTPYASNGITWFPRLHLHDQVCTIRRTSNIYGSLEFSFPRYVQYFSIRFTSSTSFDFWDDVTNTKLPCELCNTKVGRIFGVTDPTYISFDANSFAGYFREGDHFDSTPFPIVEPVVAQRHSSVIFLPGLQGSRLYREGLVSENQLWDPNRHQDVQDLFLKPNGTSKLSGIYTRDVVDTVDLSSENIYASFISHMNALTVDHTIKEWKVLPYDWRFDLDPIINSADMIAQVEQVAANSDTGKVTIVAHSHGGLVAKALITRLKAEGKAGLVDKLVLVAVPQMGAPKAVEALLHGEDVTFVKGIFVPRYLTRGLAEYMQSVFNLLPTEAYFAKVTAPVIEFDSKAISTEAFRNKYGTSITTAAKMRDFLKGVDGRKKPADVDVISPNVLLSSFITKSATRAQELDAFFPPAGLKVIQIAGWGIETVRGIKYTDRKVNGKKVLDERPLVITDGDKTVISYSATKMNTETYYVNLYEYNKLGGFKINRDHGDILEVPDVLGGLSKIIKSLPVSETEFLEDEKPVDPVVKNRLSVHSPVSIDLYDTFGNHTGLAANPDPASDMMLLDEQIPNSAYYEFGEGKYVSVPDEGNYRVVVKGLDIGTFTLESEEGTNGDYQTAGVFEDVPVTPQSVATLMLTPAGPSALALDVDGNGTTDTTLNPGEQVSLASLLDILEYAVNQTDLAPNQIRKFDVTITKIKKATTEQKIANVERRLENLKKMILKKMEKGNVTRAQGENLIALIDQIKARMR